MRVLTPYLPTKATLGGVLYDAASWRGCATYHVACLALQVLSLVACQRVSLSGLYIFYVYFLVGGHVIYIIAQVDCTGKGDTPLGARSEPRHGYHFPKCNITRSPAGSSQVI